MLTARTLEICEDLGLGDALRQIAPPLERWRRFRYCDRVDARDCCRSRDHGAAPACAPRGGERPARACARSPCSRQRCCLEALRRAGRDSRYGRRVVDVGLGGDGVACVLDDGATLDAEYLVAADGPTLRRGGVVLAAAENDAADRVPGVAHHLDAPALQHFVSVAFRSRDLAARLRARPAACSGGMQPATMRGRRRRGRGPLQPQFPAFPPGEQRRAAAAPRACGARCARDGGARAGR